MGALGSMLTGLSGAITDYVGQQQSAQAETAKQQGEANIDVAKENQIGINADNRELTKQGAIQARQSAMDKQKQSEMGVMSRDMAEQVLPGHGGDIWDSFSKQNNRPPTMKEGQDFFESRAKMIEAQAKGQPDPAKEEARQDKLENAARTLQTSVRGDKSLLRTEEQRDAASLAYKTLDRAQTENRPLSQMEYTDLLGQLWKARTGSAPTSEALKDLQAHTGQGDLNKMYQYFTGNPTAVGASPQAIMGNLKDFVIDSGLQADKQHSAYWSKRMIKPTGLRDDIWEKYDGDRGLSFSDQTQVDPNFFQNRNKQKSSNSGWKIKY